MQQSSVIAAYLLIGFIVFIIVKGQLPAYLKVIGMQPTGTTFTAPKLSSPAPSNSILGMKV